MSTCSTTAPEHKRSETGSSRFFRPKGTHLVADRGVVVGIQEGKSKGREPPIDILRLGAIRRLIQDRHGGPCDTDDGELYLAAALPCLQARATATGKPVGLLKWAETWTPALVIDKGPEWFSESEDRPVPRHSADDVAKLLSVKDEEQKRLDLKTFGAIDRPRAQRLRDCKIADRERKRKQRLDRGMVPRSPAGAPEPWRALGISRATYFRRRKAGRTKVET